MADEQIVVGIDIGTTKVCTLVARVEGEHSMRILGVGIEPSQGIRKGTIVDLQAASQSIARSIEKAERSSGLEVTAALISLAGSHVSSVNSKGVVGISGRVIEADDVARALDAAQAVAIPHNREIIHVIQRGFTVDGQDGIRMPIGMHGYRLEVEAHIITAAAATVENLRQIVQASGVEVTQFVLNPLASAEVVLSETERQMGAVVCDIGGGTTDMAIYIDGDVWHTMVLGVGGNHVTSDIAHGLRLSMDQAEEVKKQYGHAVQNEVDEKDVFTVRSFGEEAATQVSRRELAMIIEARMEEIFDLVLQEIKRSGYDGLLPAGMILTGGCSLLPGARSLASRVMGLPVRIARPENMVGLTDQLHSPAYSTSVGLLYWALMMSETGPGMAASSGRGSRRKGGRGGGTVADGSWNNIFEALRTLFKRLLP
jgi:cell division protein FtsA